MAIRPRLQLDIRTDEFRFQLGHLASGQRMTIRELMYLAVAEVWPEMREYVEDELGGSIGTYQSRVADATPERSAPRQDDDPEGRNPVEG